MRPDASIRELKGVGPKMAELFAGKEIFTVGDLLRFYPSGYDCFEEETEAARAEAGAFCTLRLKITGPASTFRKGSRTITHVDAADRSGRVRLTFFNMPYVRQTLGTGGPFVFRGILRKTGAGSLFMEQPWFADAARYEKLKGTLQPQYPVIRGIGPDRMRGLLKAALESVEGMRDPLPQKMRDRVRLLSCHEALTGIHFPKDRLILEQARRRLIFEEFFSFIVGMRRQKLEEGERLNPDPMTDRPEWVSQLLGSLPYALTAGQAQAWEEIRADLTGPVLMNRLLQGDVGSGKTILAFLALVLTAQNGRQGALMAPTEVLARQHMEDFCSCMEKSGLPVRAVLLTGSVKGKARREALARIENGGAHVVIGTHALFQEAMRFHDLGLVVTDEQHRFGVRQRTGLAEKGEDVPVLVMSATPIPRTLAIVLYGDLQVSSLRELPPGRTPIQSLALPDTQRGRAYKFILSQIRQGRQCYVICPAVEEGEIQEIENVADYTEKLRASLPEDLRIASLTGRMSPMEKTSVMDRFAAGDADLLVSTTVIEVGINVPNATVILIENAERFGLSQLHQLRGRVGRGTAKSYCIFLYSGKEKPQRLCVLEKNADGFSIAEQDLKTRGPGDLFGVRQSGMPQFALADLYEDADLLKEASVCADEILREDPSFRYDGERRVDLSTI